jgi:hypothetical protein
VGNPRACVVLFAACLAGRVPIGANEVRAKPTIVLHVVNSANVPERELATAQHHIARVFTAIGVDIVWAQGPTTPDNPDARQISLILLSKAMAERQSAEENVPVNVLGRAAHGGDRAWVFYERIANAARRHGLDIGTALARVLVHEIGHLLAPTLGHAERGVMRGVLDLAPANSELFSAEQGIQIRRSLLVAIDQRRIAKR